MKYLYLVCFLIFAGNVSAKDVSSFNVDGLRLGMDYSEAKKRLKSTLASKYDYNNCDQNQHYVICNADNGSYIEIYESSLTGKVVRVYKMKEFDLEPKWNILREQILRRYGEPDIKSETGYKRVHEAKVSCYGDCYFRNIDGWWGKNVSVNDNGTGMTISYGKGGTAYTSEAQLKFDLFDAHGYGKHQKNQSELRRKSEERKRVQQSTID